MTCPCGICEERFVGCHAKCEAYKAWDAEKWKQREEEYRKRNREDMLDDFKASAMQKQRRKRR